MKINPNVQQVLNQNLIGHEGMLYLLALYFGLSIECIPDIIQKKVNLLKIVEREFDTIGNGFSLKWNIPLFEGEFPTQSQWEWVNEFRDLFKRVNPERNGTKTYCIARMKKFFAKFPEFRKDDVMKATESYLKTVSDPRYCKTAHKFIFEGSGISEYSLLLDWCEKVKDQPQNKFKIKKMGE